MDLQQRPTPIEYEVTGSVGTVLYSFIFLFTLYAFRGGIKSRTSRRFFIVISIMSCFELPRFIALWVEKSYSSPTAQKTYVVHMMASSFFFVAFSIVCHQWSGLLKLGSYSRMIYSTHALIGVNAVFLVVDVIGIAACLSEASLASFFESEPFEIFTFLEAVRNVVYSSMLLFFGVRLVSRFWHYSSIEQVSSQGSHPSFDNSVFMQAVVRLTILLSISTFCFFLRVIMLAAKMAAFHTSHKITSKSFPLFGFWWFTFSDFIPRAIPSLAFIVIMQTRRMVKDSRRAISVGAAADASNEDFQFVPLAGAEMGSSADLDHPTNAFGDDDDDDDGSSVSSFDSDNDVDDLFTVSLRAESRYVSEDEPVEV